MSFFKRRRPEPPNIPPPDSELLAKDLAEADQLHVEAERQAYSAAIAVHDLRQVNLRNGFAPAIVASVKRQLGEAT